MNFIVLVLAVKARSAGFMDAIFGHHFFPELLLILWFNPFPVSLFRGDNP